RCTPPTAGWGRSTSTPGRRPTSTTSRSSANTCSVSLPWATTTRRWNIPVDYCRDAAPRGQDHAHLARDVGAIDGGAGGAPPLHHFGGGKAETIAPPAAHDHRRRPRRLDEARRRRRPAAVVGRLDDVGRAHGHRCLARGLEVPGEKDAPPGELDRDDQRVVVRPAERVARIRPPAHAPRVAAGARAPLR